MNNMNVDAVILGAGSGSRMGAGQNKIFLPLMGVPLIIRSIAPFTAICGRIVIACAPGEEELMRETLRRFGLEHLIYRVVPGGNTRQESVYHALNEVPSDSDFVLIHDGARALVTEEILFSALESAKKYGSGIASVPVIDTIKMAGPGGEILNTPARDSLFAVQTPQAFRTDLIRKAYQFARENGICGTDDASLLEAMNAAVHLSSGSRENLKMTTPLDLKLAELILEERENSK